ncbi:MAG TPA: nucleotide exchange factor GrpE [Nocardioides sp.]
MTAPGDGDREEVNDPSVDEPTESNLAEGDPQEVHEAPEGAAAEGAAEADDADTSLSDRLAVAEMDAAESRADAQRIQAEYVNYKRRVERDRELLAQNAAYKVLTPVVEVLDTIDRAKEHGPLEGGFKAVADQLERVVGAQGLTRFGEPGDAFDPNLHEALSHLGTDAEVTVQTVKVVAKAGYRFGDRVVRAAQVLVVDPED